MDQNTLFVGIDVSKERLDVAFGSHDTSQPFPYTDGRLKALLAKLQTFPSVQLILEATGGLEGCLMDALPQASIPFSRVNPRQVRDFWRSDPNRCPRCPHFGPVRRGTLPFGHGIAG